MVWPTMVLLQLYKIFKLCLYLMYSGPGPHWELIGYVISVLSGVVGATAKIAVLSCFNSYLESHVL